MEPQSAEFGRCRVSAKFPHKSLVLHYDGCLVRESLGEMRPVKADMLAMIKKETGVSKTPGCQHPLKNERSFEKGLADRGGWREEILHMPGIQASFLYPFSYAPLGEEDTFLENVFGSFWGFVCRQPPPANPFSKRRKMRGDRSCTPSRNDAPLAYSSICLGDRLLSNAGTGKNGALSMSVPNPSPVKNKKSCTHGSRNLIQYCGRGQAPKAFPDSSSVLDQFHPETDDHS